MPYCLFVVMPSEEANTFSNHLVDVMIAARKKANLSQEKLSRKGDIDRTAIYRFERKDRLPSILFYHDYAKACDTTLARLVAEAEELSVQSE